MRYLPFLLPLCFLLCCQSPTPNTATARSAIDQQDSISSEYENEVSATTASVQEVIEKDTLPIFDYDTTQWTDVASLDESIVMDLRYATENNFVETQMYDCGRCFLRPKVAKAVVQIHRQLQEKGLGLKMYDCYRPRPIQWALWKKVPDPRYVADPRKGSMHNRGGAVDLTIVDSLGQELDMGTDFDFFGRRAYHEYQELPDIVLANRTLLKTTMEANGFKGIRTEWWHYGYRGTGYPLDDMVWNCGHEH
ncbi:MAG: M15 family metallopeptidase [Bacteroidota bacterium]